MSPLVETVPVAGKVGKQVIILGNGLTGSTSVKFNGKSAAFHVVSDTEITATVPSGATTGTVSVVTPTGTLNSNPQFVVTK
jgi:large repetitive protein